MEFDRNNWSCDWCIVVTTALCFQIQSNISLFARVRVKAVIVVMTSAVNSYLHEYFLHMPDRSKQTMECEGRRSLLLNHVVNVSPSTSLLRHQSSYIKYYWQTFAFCLFCSVLLNAWHSFNYVWTKKIGVWPQWEMHMSTRTDDENHVRFVAHATTQYPRSM
jgi:hypothetical protein